MSPHVTWTVPSCDTTHSRAAPCAFVHRFGDISPLMTSMGRKDSGYVRGWSSIPLCLELSAKRLERPWLCFNKIERQSRVAPKISCGCQSEWIEPKLTSRPDANTGSALAAVEFWVARGWREFRRSVTSCCLVRMRRNFALIGK